MSTASQTSAKTTKTTKTAKTQRAAKAARTSATSTKTAKPAKARKPRAAAAPNAGASVARAGAKRSPVPRAAKSKKPATPAASAAETQKPPKTKLVRDSFTMPKAEYVVIDALKQRSSQAGRPLKKSEVLRAGVKALAAMADADFAAAIANVSSLKTGRPKSKKTAEPESQQ